MKFITSFYYTFGTKVISLFILLLSRILTARILGPAELGSLGNALNFTTIVSRWGSMGIAPATQFVSSKYPLQKNTVFFYAIFASVLLGIVNLIFLVYFKNEIPNWQFQSDMNAQWAYLKFIPFLPFIIVSMTLPILLLGSGQIKKYSFTQILPLLLQTVILLIAYFQPLSLDVIILAQIIYWLSTVFIAFFLIGFKNFSLKADKDLLLIFVKYALKSWPQVILQFGITRFAVLIGSQYLSSKNLGYYILASNLSESFLVINTSITPLLFNRISAQGSNIKLLGISLRLSIISFLPVLLITAVFGKPIFIFFFSSEFDQTWNLLLLLLLSILFHSLARICINYIAALGKNTIISMIQLFQLTVLFVVCTLSCPAFGVFGLCWASIAASLAGFVLCIISVQKYEKEYSGSFSLFRFTKNDVNIIFQILGIKVNYKK